MSEKSVKYTIKSVELELQHGLLSLPAGAQIIKIEYILAEPGTIEDFEPSRFQELIKNQQSVSPYLGRGYNPNNKVFVMATLLIPCPSKSTIQL
jgi:hypothetical protein